MASQITHIVYGKKIFDRHQNLNWHDFVLGTVFPDIRYLAKLDRDSTHVYGTSEINIPTDNSFQSGVYTHCFIDERRNHILKSLGMYELIPHDYLNLTAIKMVEDSITFPLFDDWGKIITILDDIVVEQKKIGVSTKNIHEWQTGLQRYIRSHPCENSWEKALVDILPYATAKQIAIQATKLQQSKQICDILKEVYKKI